MVGFLQPNVFGLLNVSGQAVRILLQEGTTVIRKGVFCIVHYDMNNLKKVLVMIVLVFLNSILLMISCHKCPDDI